MQEYIREIEKIAAKYTESQSDGYSQIMRICDAMREQKKKLHHLSLININFIVHIKKKSSRWQCH